MCIRDRYGGILRRGEVVNPKLLRVFLLIVEITSLPLLVLCLVYLLTSYQMLIPGLRLIPRPRLVHTDRVLRVLLATLALAHSYSGLILLCERRIRNSTLRKLVELSITLLLAYFAILLGILEIMVPK